MPNQTALKVNRNWPITLTADTIDSTHHTGSIEVNDLKYTTASDNVEDLMAWWERVLGDLTRQYGSQALPVAFLNNVEGDPSLHMVTVDRNGVLRPDADPRLDAQTTAEAAFRKWRREIIRRPAASEPLPAPEATEDLPAAPDDEELAEDLTEPQDGHRGWTGLTPAVSAEVTDEICQKAEAAPDEVMAAPEVQEASLRVREPLDASNLKIREPEPEPYLTIPDPTTFQMPSRQDEDEDKLKAKQGLNGWINNFGLSLEPGPAEKQMHKDIETIVEGWDGPKVLTSANPKGGVGKSTILLEAMSTLSRFGAFNAVVADFNEAVGNSDERSGVKGRARGTVRDLARWAAALDHHPAPAEVSAFVNGHPRDRYHHVRAHEPQGRGDRMTGADVQNAVWALAPSYGLIGADTSNSMDTETWEQVLADTDQLIVPVSSPGASTGAAKMFNLLINTWGGPFVDLARNAIVVVTIPNAGMRRSEIKELEETWADEVRAVIRVPYDRHLGKNHLHYEGARQRTQRALVSLGAEITRGLQGVSA